MPNRRPQIEKRLPPKRETSQMRVRRSPRRIPSIKQRLNHKRGSSDEITLDERGRNPQDTKASPRELPIASSIVSALRFVARVSVNLDDKLLISKLTSQSATKLPSYDFGEISSLAS
jgi:hypothetical protein